MTNWQLNIEGWRRWPECQLRWGAHIWNYLYFRKVAVGFICTGNALLSLAGIAVRMGTGLQMAIIKTIYKIENYQFRLSNSGGTLIVLELIINYSIDLYSRDMRPEL